MEKGISQALAQELPYWRSTGEQDWANAGSPLEDGRRARIRATDSVDVARRKILKMLLRNTSIDDWGGDGIDGPWTDAEKRKLLLAWAKGWSDAAARSCLKAAQEYERDE